MATRREALATLALGLGVSLARGALAQPAENAVYVGIQTSVQSGRSDAVFYAASGAAVGRVPLDYRAHGMTAQGSKLVVFPRRPGNRFAVLDQTSLEVLAVIRAPADRHFYGHGAFNRDGRYLIVTENDLETLNGRLGIYEVADHFKRVGDIALPRPGPHEIIRQPGSDVFYVALGGLMTHPDYGRTKLNLEDFQSEVVAYDLSRNTIEQMGLWTAGDGISFRHMALDQDGQLYVGGQRERGKGEVLWLVTDGGAAEIETGEALQGYVSSIATHGASAIVTSKESGRALRLRGGQVIGHVEADGMSAVALGPDVTVTSGHRVLQLNEKAVLSTSGFEFDNHGLMIPLV